MAILGCCKCKNIEVRWYLTDYRVIPRKCQCQYCISKNATYVSETGTRVEVLIHTENLHQVHKQGTRSAEFHLCGGCDELVFVTALIDGELYCALNSNSINNPLGFRSSIKMQFFDQSATEKKDRWHQNWCHPVLITSQGSSDAETGAPAMGVIRN